MCSHPTWSLKAFKAGRDCTTFTARLGENVNENLMKCLVLTQMLEATQVLNLPRLAKYYAELGIIEELEHVPWPISFSVRAARS